MTYARALIGLALAAMLADCSGASHGAGGASESANLVPSVQASAPKLLLDEEFDEPSLDTSLWARCYGSVNAGQRCTNGGSLELEWYEPGNVRLENGFANLIAEPHPSTRTHPYTSGMIQTGGTASTPPTFTYRYGYAEIRAKLPRGPGMWPAFWLVPTNRWPPELDIMEWQGVGPRVDIVTVHWRDDRGRTQASSTGVDTGVNLWEAYHTYGADWEPDAITWYFDGKPIKRFAQKRWIPHVPMIVILNLAIGGWEPGQHHPQARDFPATFSIDYVRIWNRKP